MEKTELSPDVRCMLALVGAEAPFEHGRQQIELRAGIEATAKAVERTAEAIGADVAAANSGRFSAPATKPADCGGPTRSISELY